jgi:hypothetical protein
MFTVPAPPSDWAPSETGRRHELRGTSAPAAWAQPCAPGRAQHNTGATPADAALSIRCRARCPPRTCRRTSAPTARRCASSSPPQREGLASGPTRPRTRLRATTSRAPRLRRGLHPCWLGHGVTERQSCDALAPAPRPPERECRQPRPARCIGHSGAPDCALRAVRAVRAVLCAVRAVAGAAPAPAGSSRGPDRRLRGLERSDLQTSSRPQRQLCPPSSVGCFHLGPNQYL